MFRKKDNIVKVYLIDISEHSDYESKLPKNFMPKRSTIIGPFVNNLAFKENWLVINRNRRGIIDIVSNSIKFSVYELSNYELCDMYIGHYRLD